MSYPTDVGVPHKKKTLSATKPTNISQEQEPIGYKYLPMPLPSRGQLVM
jgi:hypothetical protein